MLSFTVKKRFGRVADLMQNDDGTAARLRDLVIDLAPPRFSQQALDTLSAPHLNSEQMFAVDRYEEL